MQKSKISALKKWSGIFQEFTFYNKKMFIFWDIVTPISVDMTDNFEHCVTGFEHDIIDGT